MATRHLSDDALTELLRGLLRNRPGGFLFGAPWLLTFADPRARRLLSQGEDAVLVARLVSDIYNLHDYRRWEAAPLEPIVTAALASSKGQAEIIDAVVDVLGKCEDYLNPAPAVWLRRLRELSPDAVERILDRWRAGTGRLGGQLRILDTEAALHLLDARHSEPSPIWLEGWAALSGRYSTADLVAVSHAPAVWEQRAEDPSSLIARSATWALGERPAAEVAEILIATVLAWSRSGAGSPAIGFAAIWSLAQPGDDASLRRLLELRGRIRHRNLAARLDAAIARLAEARRVTPAAVADQLVDAHGLDERRSRRWHAAGQTVELLIDSSGRIARQGNVAFFRKRAADWKEISCAEKAIRTTLAVQRARLEAAMIDGRRWTRAAWEATFARHPVLSSISSRLVWAAGGDLRLGEPPEGEEIGLPHPLTLAAAGLAALQREVVKGSVVQPFKQVFRETYTLLPAEIEAGGESHRFAGFPVPLKMIYALAKNRGWSGPLGQSGFEGAGSGTRLFPAHGMRAHLTHSFFGEQIGLIEELYFERPEPPGAKRPDWVRVSLIDVPDVVFSEAVRDLDLMVSVSVIGTEEQWREWETMRAAAAVNWADLPAAYFELLKAAAQKRAVLVRELLGVMGLSDRVEVSGEWARVSGQRAHYEVHLGSGLVFLEADRSHWLRIRPRPAAKQTYLPFEEDDPMTAEVISKLLLLANDSEIADRAISDQIEAATTR